MVWWNSDPCCGFRGSHIEIVFLVSIRTNLFIIQKVYLIMFPIKNWFYPCYIITFQRTINKALLVSKIDKIFEVINQIKDNITKRESNKQSQRTADRSNNSRCVVNQIFFKDISEFWSKSVTPSNASDVFFFTSLN